MTNAQKYFLIVSEELNISKAAKKLYVSQQCLSAHIKKLEQFYGVPLLERHPHLKLTPAGDMLYNTLRQMKILENSLEGGLQELSRGTNSVLRIGMHSWRARLLLPQILPEFHKLYPTLKIKIYSNVSSELEQMLLDGKLDIVIARADIIDQRIKTIDLLDETLYISINDSLLKEYFPMQYPECKETFKKGINIEDFADVPFILSLESSNSYADVMELFTAHGITPKCYIQTNISEMHLGSLSLDYGAGFCPLMMLPLLNFSACEDTLNIFPINDGKIKSKFQLAYLQRSYLPEYAKMFSLLVQKCCRQISEITPEEMIAHYQARRRT